MYIDGDGSSYLWNPAMTEGMNIYQLFWDSLGHQVLFFGWAHLFSWWGLLVVWFFWMAEGFTHWHIDFFGFSTHRVGMGWPVGLFFFEMAMKSQEMRSFTTESWATRVWEKHNPQFHFNIQLLEGISTTSRWFQRLLPEQVRHHADQAARGLLPIRTGQWGREHLPRGQLHVRGRAAVWNPWRILPERQRLRPTGFQQRLAQWGLPKPTLCECLGRRSSCARRIVQGPLWLWCERGWGLSHLTHHPRWSHHEEALLRHEKWRLDLDWAGGWQSCHVWRLLGGALNIFEPFLCVHPTWWSHL